MATWYHEHIGQKSIHSLMSFKFIDMIDGTCQIAYKQYGFAAIAHCEVNFNNRTATVMLSNLDFDFIEGEIVKRIIKE